VCGRGESAAFKEAAGVGSCSHVACRIEKKHSAFTIPTSHLSRFDSSGLNIMPDDGKWAVLADCRGRTQLVDPAFIGDKQHGPPDDATVRTYRDQLVDRNKRCSRTGDVDGAVSGDHGRSVDHWPQIDSPEDCWFVTARPESKRRSAGIPPIL